MQNWEIYLTLKRQKGIVYMKKRLSLLFITLLTLTHVQAKAFEPRTDIITDKITVIYAGYNGFRLCCPRSFDAVDGLI